MSSSLPDEWWDALRNSERLIIESRMKQFPPCPQEQRLGMAAPSELYLGAKAFAEALECPSDMLYDSSPVHAAFTLTSMLAQKLGLKFERGVDQQFTESADNTDKIVEPLESAEEFSEAIYSIPLSEQCSMLRKLLTQPRKAVERLQAVILAWQNADLAALAAIAELMRTESEALFHATVTHRNNKWMPRIRQAVSEDSATLITVGALHFVGEGSIVEQLQNDGFSVVLRD